MAPKKTCHYRFPIHPADMFAQTPAEMEESTRTMRAQMLNMIAELSQKHSQQELDNMISIDVENGEIVGMDLSRLMGANMPSMCLGEPVPLGHMTAQNWITMRY